MVLRVHGFFFLCLCFVAGCWASDDSNGRRRRRLHPTGKREVYLQTPLDGFDSTPSFHRFLIQEGFDVIHDKVSYSSDGVMVMLYEEEIRALAEDGHDLDRDSQGVMQIAGDIRVRFFDEQEFGQEQYIELASDASYVCLDEAQVCAEKDSSEFYVSYQKPNAIFLRLENLRANYSDYVRQSSMGKTYQGRDQVVYTLTNYNKPGWENNPIVFYICGMHPREAIPTMACPWIMENLLLQERDESASQFNTSSNNGLLDEVQFIVLPIYNVDGFYHVHSVDELIVSLQKAMEEDTLGTEENIALWQKYRKAKLHRKSMAPNTVRCNAASSWSDIGVGEAFDAIFPPFNKTYCIENFFGVDLNRNFPSHWMGGGAQSNIFQDAYAGLYPADQIETQNIMQFIQELNENGTVLTSTDVHCCADMWLMPNGWYPCKNMTGNECHETYGECLDLPVSMEWGKVVTDAIFKVHGNQFVYGPITTVIYPAAGSGIDWIYDTFGTVYLGAPELHQDPGWVNPTLLTLFAPNNDMILPGIQEVYAGMVAAVQFALDNPNKRVTDIESFPTPIPGYPVEYICDNVVAQELCDKDCTNIDEFPFQIQGSQSPADSNVTQLFSLPENDFEMNQLLTLQANEDVPALKGTGVDPCGFYRQDVEDGKPSYLHLQPGTIFREICPQECQDISTVGQGIDVQDSEQRSNGTSTAEEEGTSADNKDNNPSAAFSVTKKLSTLLATFVVSALAF